MHTETTHNPTSPTPSLAEMTTALPFDNAGLGVYLISPTKSARPLPNGTFSHKQHALTDLLNDPAYRADVTIEGLSNGHERPRGLSSSRPAADQGGNLIVSEDQDRACVHLVPERPVDSIGYVQRNDAEWIFECESGVPLKLKGAIGCLEPSIQTDVQWLDRFSIPASMSPCPAPLAHYLDAHLGMRASELPHGVFLCTGCLFQHGPTEHLTSGLFLFQYLHDHSGVMVGAVGVALGLDGEPITGDGVTSSTCILLPQVKPSDIYFSEFTNTNVCVAVDFHSALRFGHLTGIPAIATGTYGVLSEVHIPRDTDVRGDILVTRDAPHFKDYVYEFSKQYEDQWNWHLNLVSLDCSAEANQSKSEE